MAPAPAKDRTATRNGRRSERGRGYHPAHDIDTVLARLRRHARHQGRRGRLPVRGRRLARGRRRPALPRCHRGAVVLQRRLRAARDRRCGRGAARAAPGIFVFGAYTTEPTLHLADRLAALAADRRCRRVLRDPADRTRSIPRPSSRAATGTSRVGRRSASSSRASTATTACTRGAPHWPASRQQAGYGGDIIEEVVHVGASDTESLGAPVRVTRQARSRRSSASR